MTGANPFTTKARRTRRLPIINIPNFVIFVHFVVKKSLPIGCSYAVIENSW